MAIRDKWISCHPLPPQDNRDEESDAHALKSKRSVSFTSHEDFRRRQPPHYDVFSHPLPATTLDYSYQMVNGIVHVTKKIVIGDTAARSSDSILENEQACELDTSVLEERVFVVLSFEEFVKDFNYVSSSHLNY